MGGRGLIRIPSSAAAASLCAVTLHSSMKRWLFSGMKRSRSVRRPSVSAGHPGKAVPPLRPRLPAKGQRRDASSCCGEGMRSLSFL